MGPPLYEIDESIEKHARQALEGASASLQPRGNLKKWPEGEEQYWSVVYDGMEVFCFGVMLEFSGRRLLIMGPKRKSTHIHLYDSMLSELEKSGAKRLEKL